MLEYVDAYIEAHETAWSSSTLSSERSRLRALGNLLHGTPEDTYQGLTQKKKKIYTIKTTFIRICALEAWIGKETKYKEFMRKHANRFKHAYKKEEIGITYGQAQDRIGQLPSGAKEYANSLLSTGLRISESTTVTDGTVVGKGGKVRKVYGRIEGVMPKSAFYKRLRQVGLKPHTLRKLCATRLAEAGATPADLCKVFGWSSISTAYQYLQAKDDEKLGALMEKSQKGS